MVHLCLPAIEVSSCCTRELSGVRRQRSMWRTWAEFALPLDQAAQDEDGRDLLAAETSGEFLASYWRGRSGSLRRGYASEGHAGGGLFASPA